MYKNIAFTKIYKQRKTTDWKWHSQMWNKNNELIKKNN